MGKRVVTKVGDIFCVKIDEKSKKFFQFISKDSTQLNSDVIRSFTKVYPINSTPDLSEIISDVEFYAHCMTSIGVKLGCWEKFGNIMDLGTLEVVFRDSNDHGNPEITQSSDWYIWKINSAIKNVGKLKEKYHSAEIGLVINPFSIICRMKTGSYDFVYPNYESMGSDSEQSPRNRQ